MQETEGAFKWKRRGNSVVARGKGKMGSEDEEKRAKRSRKGQPKMMKRHRKKKMKIEYKVQVEAKRFELYCEQRIR